MYPEGFDIQAVVRKLRSAFAVEQALPLEISLMLARLQGAEPQPVQELETTSFAA